jgi:hypothetical protein
VLGIKPEDNNLTYSLGIGYPDESLKWYQSKNNKEYLTGGPVDYSIKSTDDDLKYSMYSKQSRDIKVWRV